MSKSPSRENIFRWMLINVIVLILLMRLVPVFRFLFSFILLAIAGGLLAWAIWYFAVKRPRDKRYAASAEGQIENRIAFCEAEIAKQENEIREIEESINELEHQLRGGEKIAEQNRLESKKLIKAFGSQLALRRSKITFYEACIQKLDVLLQNQRLASDLEVKKKKLEKLQENNFEELAKLETMRSDVEMEVLYLDTIDELSLRIQDTNTVDDAEFLQQELEKMTEELK